MAKRQLAMDIIWQEQINFGGQIMTRRTVWNEMRKEGFLPPAVDLFVFGHPALTPEDLERMEANRCEFEQNCAVWTRAAESEGDWA